MRKELTENVDKQIAKLREEMQEYVKEAINLVMEINAKQIQSLHDEVKSMKGMLMQLVQASALTEQQRKQEQRNSTGGRSPLRKAK